MESKHTKGPWRVNDDRNEGLVDDEYHFIAAGDGLCSPPKYNGFEISGCMTIHDARLIAAAPELLEALQHIVEYWNRDRDDEAMHNALWHIIETAESAIATATRSQS